ncbi:MAG: MYXO-CTERM sorting domain-containing protein, partial [Myxococcota bacterium]
CEFSDGECVPMLLGLDGQGDLGASFLSGFAAGAHGPMRILAALAGDARVENNGLSLQMYGGAQSLNRELDPDSFPGHDACVPVTDPPELPDIPLAMSLEGNTVPGTGEPTHVGIGIAESFIDYAAWNAFDSGMLCLGAGTSLAQELSTGLFSLLVQSLNNVTFPHSEQPLAIMVRPQQPPDIDIGETAEDDPLMNVELPELELDFYVWTQERYVRFMTYKADLALDVNLQVDGAAGTIAPVIGEVEASNSEITNSDILSEDPQMLAGTIEGLIGSFAGMLTGSIDAIELPEIEGFELDVPEGGVQGFEDEGERFLGIFANLGLAGASTGARHPVETELEIVDVTMDPESLRLEGFGQGNPTTIVARAEAFGTGVDYEYSYRLDGMEWSQWTTNPKLVIQDEVLFFQARHTLEVRARVAGMPETVDPTPASEEILIDVLAPTVETESTDEGVRVVAADVVSPRDALQYRYRVEGGDWSEWAGLDGEPVLDAAPDGVDVEVRDEAGNVGSNRQALIRGLPDANAEGACDCAVPGSTSSGTPLAGLGALLLLGLALRRRRSQTGRGKAAAARLMKAVRRVAPFLALPLALYVVGCGGKDGGGGGSACEDDCVRATFDTPTGGLCCESEGMCVAYDLDELCEGVEFCHEDEVELDDDCGVVCNECVLPPNTPGQIATYTDMTALSDGSLAISGYNPGNPSTSPQRLFGDLVVGISDGSEIEWEPVDGVPDSPPTLAEDSWRGGVVEPGPDVGQWTSVAAADDDTLYVSYYDVSNQGVKIAIGTPGDWAMHTIEEEGDAGLHTSITLEDGSPRIAYLQILPPEGDGQPTARVRVAMADGANPAAATDWEVTTAHEASIDCRPQWCPDGTTCVASGQCLADPGDAEELPDPYIEDMPVAPGLYNNLFVDSDGLALVFYDRTMGRIRAVRWQGDTWSAPMDLDGYQVPGSDSGDSGIGASVFVEGDVWHLTYVDGANEHLMYARVEDAGATVATREVVDDGAVEGGRHVVGDDSSVVVADGEIRVVYQDSTVAHALIATRSEEDTWEVATLDDENFTGFWLEQVAMDGTSYVSTFWMRTAAAGSGTRILTYP